MRVSLVVLTALTALTACGNGGASTDAVLSGASRDPATYSFDDVSLAGPNTSAIRFGDSVFEFVEGEDQITVGLPEDTSPELIEPGILVSFPHEDGHVQLVMQFGTGQVYFRDMAHFQDVYSVGEKELQGHGIDISLHLDPNEPDVDYFMADRVKNARANTSFRITDVNQPDPNVMEIRVRGEFSALLYDQGLDKEVMIPTGVIVGTFRGNDCASLPNAQNFPVCRVPGFVPVPQNIYTVGPGEPGVGAGGIPNPAADWIEMRGFGDWDNTSAEVRTMPPDGETSPPHNNYRLFYNSALVTAIAGGIDPPIGAAAVVESGNTIDGIIQSERFQLMVRLTDLGDPFDWWFAETTIFGVQDANGIAGGIDTNRDTNVGTCYGCHSDGATAAILGSLTSQQ